MRRSLAVVFTAAAVVATVAPCPVRAEDPPGAVAPAPPAPAAPAPSAAPEAGSAAAAASAAAPVPSAAPPPPASIPDGASGAPAAAAAAAEAPAPQAGVQEARRVPEPDVILGADPGLAGSTASSLPPGARTFPVAGGLDPLGSTSAAAASAAKTPAASSALPAPPPPSAATTAKAKKPWRTLPLIGFNFGLGFPDLANANLTVRPINWVRLFAGPSWGYLAWGLQGGVVLSPINWYINPTLTFQAGKLFRINASKYVKDETDSDGTVTRLSPLAERVDFHYYAGDLGLELGSPRSFSFFLKAGLSFIVIKANGTGSSTKTDGTVMSISNPKISAWAPSAKLGFQFWF